MRKVTQTWRGTNLRLFDSIKAMLAFPSAACTNTVKFDTAPACERD